LAGLVVSAIAAVNCIAATVAKIAALVIHLRAGFRLAGIDARTIGASLAVTAIGHAVPFITAIAVDIAASLDTVAQAAGLARRALI
jgi:hypothetical protein